jgi:hypothetical protein
MITPPHEFAPGFAHVKRLGLETGLPEIEESTSYGTPALKVRGKLLVRMYSAEVLVVHCPMAEKEVLMEALPDIFFQTDHYKGYPAFLVRLSVASDEDIKERIERAWRMMAPARLQASYDQGSIGAKSASEACRRFGGTR